MLIGTTLMLATRLASAQPAPSGASGLEQQFFRLKPVDLEVIEGDVAELGCQVGHQVGAVQWSKDGFLLGFQASIAGYPRYAMIMEPDRGIYNLRIHNTQLDDEAEYQCQVGPAPKQQAIRASSRLSVIVPPKSLTMSGARTEIGGAVVSMVEAREGEKVVLVCLASAAKPPPRIKWFRKHIELLPEASRTYYNKSAASSKYLLFTSESSLALYPKADEQYSCEVQHPGLLKPMRASALLNILSAPGTPSIEGFKEGDIVNVGEQLTLSCVSRSGYPPPKVIWSRNGIEVDRSAVVGSRNEVINTFTFTVSVEDNQAVYRCSVANSQTAKPLESAIRLNVLFLPAKVSISGPSEAKLFQTISVVCTTRPANPPPRISWLLDGSTSSPGLLETKSDGASAWVVTSTLTVTITRQEPKVKTFMCLTESSALKETVNATHRVSVIYAPKPPILIGFQQGTAVVAGSLQKFKCVSQGGHPSPTLKWYREEREISAIASVSGSGVSSELVIRPEALDNGVTYRCVASSPAVGEPGAHSVSFKLAVHYPPAKASIRVEPVLIKANETVRVECLTGESSPAATIEWRKNGKRVMDEGRESLPRLTTDGQPRGELTRSWFSLNASAQDDGSVITCLARNPLIEGSLARDDFALTVLYKPVFEAAETHLLLAEGENKLVNLSCRANPRLEAFEWKRATADAGSPSDARAPNPSPSALLPLPHRSMRTNGTLLFIWNISRHEAGKYVAVASNRLGISRSYLFLDVLYSASIEEPINVITSSGKRGLVPKEDDAFVELQCRIHANPAAKVLWRKQGNENNIDYFRAKLRDEKSATLQTSALIIYNVSRQDAGLYTCSAANGVGPPLDATANVRLNVAFKPSLLNHGKGARLAVSPGARKAQLACVAKGYPAVDFAWQDVDSTAKYHVLATKVEVSPSLGELYRSELVVNDLKESDFKKYRCTASNNLGSDYLTVELVHRSIPDAPSKLRAINTTHDAVHLAWEPRFDGGLEQSFRVQYHRSASTSDSPDKGRVDNRYAYAAANSSSLVVDGLEPNTLYLFVLTARNELGESDASDDIMARTTMPPAKNREADTKTFAASGEPRLGAGFSDGGPVFLIACVVASLLVSTTATVVLIVACYQRRMKKRRDTQAKHASQEGDSFDGGSGGEDVTVPYLISPGSLALGYCSECDVLPSAMSSSGMDFEGASPLGKCLCAGTGDYDTFPAKLMSSIGQQQPDILMNQIKESECINHGGLCLPGSGFKLLTTDETTIGVELASPGSNAPRSARTVSILATSDFPISLSTLHEEVEELV